MPIPAYQTLLRPLLAYAQDGGEKNFVEAIKALANEFHVIGLEEMEAGLIFRSRVQTAQVMLREAGAIKTTRLHFVITDLGRELLKKYPERVELSILMQLWRSPADPE